MKTIIYENARGFLFKKGRYIKMLEPGRYREWGDRTIEYALLAERLNPDTCTLDVLLRDKAVAEQTTTLDVPDQTLALHFVNGQFTDVLRPGTYAFWTVFDRHTFTMVDIADPAVSPDIPAYIFAKIPSYLYHKLEVAEYQKARLYYDNRLVKLLDAGTYYFWKGAVDVKAEWVDTRLMQMDITGQEVLTRDKVTVRINFMCRYRLTDWVKVLTEIADYEEQLHVVAQLAIRDYVGRYRLDDLLENKEQLSAFVQDALTQKAAALYVEITDAGVKDIILPGEIREIMNTVLVAEKRAQANVITRREEVASTRSLLNTARLMEENQTLYKLKELEYLEKICANVGHITVDGRADLLQQLTTIMRGTA